MLGPHSTDHAARVTPELARPRVPFSCGPRTLPPTGRARLERLEEKVSHLGPFSLSGFARRFLSTSLVRPASPEI